jgi:hypothetical protein
MYPGELIEGKIALHKLQLSQLHEESEPNCNPQEYLAVQPGKLVSPDIGPRSAKKLLASNFTCNPICDQNLICPTFCAKFFFSHPLSIELLNQASCLSHGFFMVMEPPSQKSTPFRF